MGLDIDLYTPKIDIGDDGADDIIIEITGLKSISKFIGLGDTPLYYDNGKFFKVEDNKIVYTDIQWKDISGNLEDAPEIIDLIKELVKNINEEVINDYIDKHNNSQLSHPYIRNVIEQNYDTLDTKINDTKEELSETIQNETLARIEADATLQNNIDTLTNNLNTEIENRTNADDLLRDDIDNISGELAQEILNRQTQDNLLQEQITSNYNTLDNKIDTEISNRTSVDTTLQNNIDAEALARQNADATLQGNIDTLSDTVSNNYNDLSDQIDNLSDTVSDNYTNLDGKISDLTITVNNNNTAINNKVDGINTTLTNSVNSLSNTVSSNYTTLDTKINNTKTSLEGDISDLSNTVSQNYTDLSNAITSSSSIINSRIDSEVSTLNTAIGTETTNRQNADNNLQSQIDAIVSSSDVFDIVGTYAELQAYDISTVPVNDIIKVLVDSSHDNSATYYRCIETASVKSWSYIGSEGAYYTKSESDTKFVDKTTTINNIPLSSNITLTASDVNALPNTTVIGDGVLTLQKNGVNIGTFNANTTANKSINITVPTDTADLTNGAEFITAASLPTVNNGTLDIQVNGTSIGTFTANQSGNTTANIVVPDSVTWGNITGTLSNQTDLQTALNSKYDTSNPDGYITSADLPTNYVTTDTAQDISGHKTFLGEKAIYFKQNATTDKLGFTLYNPSNAELGALEWRPNIINGNALLALNCPQTGSNYVGFRYWSGINVVAPRPTTNGNYFIPVNVTDGTNTVTANNNGTLNISTLLPDVSNFVTNSSLATTLADYQPLLISGTNIKTINNESILDSGNIDTDNVYWATYGTTTFTDIMTAINAGKLVMCSDTSGGNSVTFAYRSHTNTTITFYNGSDNSNTLVSVDSNNDWDLTDGLFLPSQTGNSGKFLTTNGFTASWATVTIPTPTYDSTNERITW